MERLTWSPYTFFQNFASLRDVYQIFDEKVVHRKLKTNSIGNLKTHFRSV